MKLIFFVLLIFNFLCSELLFSSNDDSNDLKHDLGHYAIDISDTMSFENKVDAVKTKIIMYGYPAIFTIIRENFDLLKKSQFVGNYDELNEKIYKSCLIDLIKNNAIDSKNLDSGKNSLLEFLLTDNKYDFIVSILKNTEDAESYDFLLYMPLKNSEKETMHDFIKKEKFPQDFCNKVKHGLKGKQLLFLSRNNYKIEIPTHRKKEEEQIDWIRDCLNLDYRSLYSIVFENLNLLKNFKIVEEHIFWGNDLINRFLKDVVKSDHKLLNFTDYDLYGNCFFYGLMLKKEFEKKEEIIEFFLKYWPEEVREKALKMSPVRIDKKTKYVESSTNSDLLEKTYPNLYKKYVLKEIEETQKEDNVDNFELEEEVETDNYFIIQISENLSLDEKRKSLQMKLQRYKHDEIVTVIRSNFDLLKELGLLNEEDFDCNNTDQYFNTLIDHDMINLYYDKSGQSLLNYLLSYPERPFVVEHILKNLELNVCKKLLDMTCYEGEKNKEIYKNNETIDIYLQHSKPELYKIYQDRVEEKEKESLIKQTDAKKKNQTTTDSNNTNAKENPKAITKKKNSILKNPLFYVVIASAFYVSYHFKLLHMIKNWLGRLRRQVL